MLRFVRGGRAFVLLLRAAIGFGQVYVFFFGGGALNEALARVSRARNGHEGKINEQSDLKQRTGPCFHSTQFLNEAFLLWRNNYLSEVNMTTYLVIS